MRPQTNPESSLATATAATLRFFVEAMEWNREKSRHWADPCVGENVGEVDRRSAGSSTSDALRVVAGDGEGQQEGQLHQTEDP
jgi:hypothetical protein